MQSENNGDQAMPGMPLATAPGGSTTTLFTDLLAGLDATSDDAVDPAPSATQASRSIHCNAELESSQHLSGKVALMWGSSDLDVGAAHGLPAAEEAVGVEVDAHPLEGAQPQLSPGAGHGVVAAAEEGPNAERDRRGLGGGRRGEQQRPEGEQEGGEGSHGASAASIGRAVARDPEKPERTERTVNAATLETL